MRCISFLSDILNGIFSEEDKIINIGETGLIETIYNTKEIRETFYVDEWINTLDDITANYDYVFIDFLKVLDKHYMYNGKVFNEKTINKYLNDKYKPLAIKYSVDSYIIDIFKESFKIITNKVCRFYHPSKVIILEVYLSNCMENYELVNKNLKKLYSQAKRIIPGATFIPINDFNYEKIDYKLIKQKIDENLSSIDIFKNEKVHNSINNIRYVFEKATILNKDKLIIIFSSFSHDKPKYNYVRYLKSIDCNKLFILDDYGEKGCYYFGIDGGFEVESSIMSLITKIMNMNSISFKDVILAGSSKGGSAAIYYGFKYNFGNVIAGAPQYKIGSYLLDLSIKDYAHEIFGGIDIDKRIKYDNLIRICIGNNNKTKASILTGDGDHQYKNVLKQLEYEVEINGYDITFDKCNIENHSEIAKYFPEYLISKLNKILGGISKYSSTPIFKIIKRVRRGDLR